MLIFKKPETVVSFVITATFLDTITVTFKDAEDKELQPPKMVSVYDY